jgi:hypothetical protein
MQDKDNRPSGRELKLNLEGEAFADLRTDINEYLQMTLAKMDEINSSEAEITAKIIISLDRTELPLLTEDKKEELRDAMMPKFKHKVSALMKTKFERSGELRPEGEYELVFDEKRKEYIMRKILDPQVSLYDTDGDL